jgi:hypothetical protein
VNAGSDPRWPPDELEALANESEFTLAIKGHQAMVQVLDLAIGEVLHKPHSLEIAKLSSALKIDLAVALGIVAEDDGATLRKLNAIRNAFAHDSESAFGEDQARDFFNSWSQTYRSMAEGRSLSMTSSRRRTFSPWGSSLPPFTSKSR